MSRVYQSAGAHAGASPAGDYSRGNQNSNASNPTVDEVD
jgi:hypothetical protein